MNKIIYKTSKLKRLMDERGLTPDFISQHIEVTRPTINSILATGKGHPTKVYELAKYLGLPVKPNDLSALSPRKSA